MNYYQPNNAYTNRLNAINQQYGVQPINYQQPQTFGAQPNIFPQTQQPNIQPQFNQPYNGVIPVGGVEEVKAHPIDFTGNITYFSDISTGKIYTKQLGLNGSPEIKIYSLDNSPPANTVEQGIGDALNILNKRIEEVEGRMNNFENKIGGKINEHNANVPNVNNRKSKSSTNDVNA